MKPEVVIVPPLKNIIQPSPGFKKKDLSTKKVDLMTICGFGCFYCSSNEGRYFNANWVKGVNYKGLIEEQLGRSITKADLPTITLECEDVNIQFEKELKSLINRKSTKNHILVFSELTDGFSPNLVKDGITRKALELLIKYTDYRIRILTKNAIIGKKDWVDFFKDNKDRFLVGLSIGTLDNKWTQNIELGTSNPTQRIKALNTLQDSGVPSYGMLCPVFPDLLLEGNKLEKLIDKVNPRLDSVEEVFAEPYNDRANWQLVRNGFEKDSQAYKWLTNVFEYRRMDIWSDYATKLYLRIRKKAEKENWLHKLRYLLYEGEITESDAVKFGNLEGVLLQGNKDDKDKSSTHHVFAKLNLTNQRDEKLGLELDEIHSEIGKSLEQFKNSWIGLGINIKRMKDKMESVGNTRQNWRIYHGVEDLEDYCKKHWNISKTTYYDMLNAVEFIQETRPKLLEDYNDNEDVYIPSYAKLSPIKPQLEKLKEDNNNYNQVLDMFYDPNIGRPKLGQNIKKMYGDIIFNPLNHQFNPQDYIQNIMNTLVKHKPDNSNEINTIISELKDLFGIDDSDMSENHIPDS